MEQIKTATGKCFQSDYLAVIDTPPRVYIRIVGISLSEVAIVFGDPNETIELWHGQNHLTYYTHLVAIVPEPGAIKVVLAKG